MWVSGLVCVILTAASSRDLLSSYSCVHAVELAFRLLSWSNNEWTFSSILSRSSNSTMTQLSHTENKHTNHEGSVVDSARVCEWDADLHSSHHCVAPQGCCICVCRCHTVFLSCHQDSDILLFEDHNGLHDNHSLQKNKEQLSWL